MFNGNQSTVLMGKLEWLENNIQIINCTSRDHWGMTTTVNCIQEEIKVFDSIFYGDN